MSMKMTTGDKRRELHDKATRGKELSGEEKQQLENWYSQQDRMESEALQQTTQESLLVGLQSQIEAALAQLVKLTGRIQEVASENEKIRNENAVLLHQLSQQARQRPA